jgi:hypothetical protein
MAHQYFNATDTDTDWGITPYSALYDGVSTDEAIFIAARVATDDIAGLGDEQTVAAMWRGSGEAELTWWLSLGTDGTFRWRFEDSGGTDGDENSAALSTKGLIDGDDFWFGVETRGPSGASNTLVQFYWGGTAGEPVWETWGSQLDTGALVDGIKADTLNQLTIGIDRYNATPLDAFKGHIYELLIFDEAFDDIGTDGSNPPVCWFNGEDFVVGDGDTDTAVSSSSSGETWTLDGAVSNLILDDSAVDAGGVTWWDATPPAEETPVAASSGASPADLGARVTARRRIVDPDDPRRKFRLPY